MPGSLVNSFQNRVGIWKSRQLTLGTVTATALISSNSPDPDPWTDPASGLVITASARLDDRYSLISRLELTNRQNEIFSDPMLILMAYRKWGRDCVNYLVGAYAFVIADPRKNLLFCARDHMGAKPFYYHLSQKLFVFASSARAVAAHERVDATLNRGRIADLLVGSLEWINETCSFFESVSRLPPAHWMEVTPEKVTKVRYWDLDPTYELQLGSDEEYADALQDVFEKAILDRVPGSGVVGAMLSGGVDSSSIVGILSHNLKKSTRQPLKTWSGVNLREVGQKPCLETHFVNRMIANGGLDATQLSPSSVSDFQAELCAAEQQVEDPFDFGAAMHKLIYINARRAGCSTVFDGVDGDVVASLCTGYPKYLLRNGQYKTAFTELTAQYKNYYRRPLHPATVFGMAIRNFLPVPAAIRSKRAKSRLGQYTQTGIANSFLSSELAEHVDLNSRFAEYQACFGLGLKKSLRHEHISRIATADLTAGVERYYRLASGLGVENQQPLLDRRVVEFCVSLPWDQKCRDGWSKFALRKVASRFLPKDVAWRQGWEEIAGGFYRAHRAVNLKEDTALVLDRGESFSEFIDWPKARENARQRLAGLAGQPGPESRVLALIRWHDRLHQGPSA